MTELWAAAELFLGSWNTYSPTMGKVTALMILGDFSSEVRFIQKEGVGWQDVNFSWALSLYGNNNFFPHLATDIFLLLFCL